MTQKGILERIPENSEGIDFVIRPDNFLHVPKDQLRITAYRNFVNSFDDYMKVLGYSSATERSGAEKKYMREPQLDKFKKDGPSEWLSFDGVEVTRYQKGEALVVLESEVHTDMKHEGCGFYDDSHKIKSVKLNEDARQDTLSAIINYLDGLKPPYETILNFTKKELESIDSIKSRLENTL